MSHAGLVLGISQFGFYFRFDFCALPFKHGARCVYPLGRSGLSSESGLMLISRDHRRLAFPSGERTSYKSPRAQPSAAGQRCSLRLPGFEPGASPRNPWCVSEGKEQGPPGSRAPATRLWPGGPQRTPGLRQGQGRAGGQCRRLWDSAFMVTSGTPALSRAGGAEGAGTRVGQGWGRGRSGRQCLGVGSEAPSHLPAWHLS